MTTDYVEVHPERPPVRGVCIERRGDDVIVSDPGRFREWEVEARVDMSRTATVVVRPTRRTMGTDQARQYATGLLHAADLADAMARDAGPTEAGALPLRLGDQVDLEALRQTAKACSGFEVFLIDVQAMLAQWPVRDRVEYERLVQGGCGRGCHRIYGHHLHGPTFNR